MYVCMYVQWQDGGDGDDGDDDGEGEINTCQVSK